MKIRNPERRLKHFWGLVDKKHILSFSKFLSGKNILDLGCGLGTTTFTITQLGYNCIGIDYDKEAIEYCKKTYPQCNFKVANAEQLPFESNYFDTVVLRDALHHFYGEANFNNVKNEILRVTKPDARIIFFDPNVNFLLRTMRKISDHKDEECNYETALMLIDQMNCHVIHKSFNTLYSLPLSGGYVGLNFVPNIKILQKVKIFYEKYAEKLINIFGIGRHLCWRYLIVGERGV